MSKDPERFEEAMRLGAKALRAKQWSQAIAAYRQALTESPDNVEALTALGAAYFGAQQWASALEAYGWAIQRTPENPALHERVAQVEEQRGRRREAAQSYELAAEYYSKHPQTMPRAVVCWQRAVRLWPDTQRAHIKLLAYYRQQGDVPQAVNECLALVRIYRAQGQHEYAWQVAQLASKLAPDDRRVTTILAELRAQGADRLRPQTGGAPPADLFAVPTRTAERAPLDVSMFDFDMPEEEAASKERGSPIEITRQKALTDLAESFFEEELPSAPHTVPTLSKTEADALLSKAIDFQTRGELDEAIAAYEQVVSAGVEQPAVHFNLGLLYKEKLRFDEAIHQFEQAVLHPEYTLGSHFALGECYRARGRFDEALEHFLEVLKIVDLAMVQRDQADDLIHLYESLADSFIAKGESDQAMEFTNALVELLNAKGWEDKVAQARQRLNELAQEGPALSLAEMLTIPGSERILESISLAQEYAKRHMFYGALEECYYALDRSPSFLPIHQQIAQILVLMGLVDEAVSKLVSIADTYRVRGNIRPAMAVYQRALKLAPVDIGVRTKMIDLCVSHGEIDQALEHYLVLADSYYHLAQMDRAREVYQEALRLAPRGSSDQRWQVRILHRIGDIDMQRVDWKRAIEVYEQIRDLAPDDERARLTLVELYQRFNRTQEALAELDGLLDVYRQENKTERIFKVLEDFVREQPDDIPLRTRLAQAYLDAGDVDQALIHLDKLGDLQIEAGRVEDAKATIRIIVALNPPNVAAYKQLLAQL